MLRGYPEADRVDRLQCGVKVLVFLAKIQEVIIQRGEVIVCEDIVPDEAGGKAVENESREEAILGIGNEVLNLARCAGKDGGETRVLDFRQFMVFAAIIGYLLVVISLTEVVGIVAIIGGEGVGKGVTFGLKHKATLFVFKESLTHRGSTGISRDE